MWLAILRLLLRISKKLMRELWVYGPVAEPLVTALESGSEFGYNAIRALDDKVISGEEARRLMGDADDLRLAMDAALLRVKDWLADYALEKDS